MTLPQPTLADGFKLSVEGDKVVIEFGHGAGIAASGRPRVVVTDRIVIPQAIAQRLMLQLDDALRPHQAALRMEQAQALPPGQAAVAARPGAPSPRPPPDEAGMRAAQLIRLVGDLGVPHQYERSFQVSRGQLRANRFLLSLNRRDLPGDPAESVLGLCDQMGIPPAARAAAADAFAMAHCVHFGFEGDGTSIICKLYLERAVPPEEARAAAGSGMPVLLHLAFKWDLVRGGYVTTRYHWYPALSAEAIAGRMAMVYRGEHAGSAAIATAFLALGTGRVAAERMQYLEVEEVENDRRSFDLNLYNAGLLVRDAQSLLLQMRDCFAIRPGQFQALYDQIKALTLGHLAGGVHRSGADFFNVYYGVMSLPQFSGGFAPER